MTTTSSSRTSKYSNDAREENGMLLDGEARVILELTGLVA